MKKLRANTSDMNEFKDHCYKIFMYTNKINTFARKRKNNCFIRVFKRNTVKQSI